MNDVVRKNDDLEQLMSSVESDQSERKQAFSEPDRVAEAICAFANDLPDYRSSGVIFIGVDDAGHPTGLPITDELLKDLANLRDNGKILPFPTMFVRKVVLRGVDVAVIEVEPSITPPIRFRQRVWIRVGPRRGMATAEEERRLSEKRRANDLPFDARPVLGAVQQDLDLDLFERVYLPASLPSEILEENQRTVIERLASMRLSDLEGTPTYAGLILLGTDPIAHVPGCYVQFLRLDGTELTDPIVDEKQISGSLVSQLRQLDEVLALNIHTAVKIGSTATETRQSDYPLEALQQIVRNAVLHRTYESTHAPTRITWYSDRIEVLSPGGPFGNVTAESFGNPGVTDYRNPALAEAMRNLGYVQRFGVGIPIARKSLAKNDNPPIEFYIEPTFINVIVRSAS